MTLQLVKHHGNYDFTSGVRLMLLRGRNKDKVSNPRVITRITHHPAQWHDTFREMQAIARPGERIYATAAPRNVKKAMRLFKEAQVAAEFDDDPTRFYHKLESRWASALMKPQSQQFKVWLVDLDNEAERAIFDSAMADWYLLPENRDKPTLCMHEYKTKNGWHYLMHPFNKSQLPDDARALIVDNALALMAF